MHHRLSEGTNLAYGKAMSSLSVSPQVWWLSRLYLHLYLGLA